MVYVIDTCSLLKIGECSSKYGIDRSSILEELSKLVDNGDLIFPKQVITEIKRHANQSLIDWSVQNSEQATRYGTNYITLTEVLSHKIAKNVLDVEKVANEDNDEADPYLLELCITLKDTNSLVTLVTDEVKNKVTKISLSQAAGVLEIPSINIEFFLLKMGIV